MATEDEKLEIMLERTDFMGSVPEVAKLYQDRFGDRACATITNLINRSVEIGNQPMERFWRLVYRALCENA